MPLVFLDPVSPYPKIVQRNRGLLSDLFLLLSAFSHDDHVEIAFKRRTGMQEEIMARLREFRLLAPSGRGGQVNAT